MIGTFERSRRLVHRYNHNIPYGGVVYHVQTEFLASGNPHVETHVFSDGQVVGYHRTEVDLDPEDSDAQIVQVMKIQQKEMIRRLISGQLTGSGASPTRPTGSEIPSTSVSTAAPVWAGPAEPGHPVANLELRRSLVRFVRAVQPDQPPADDAIVDRLRSVITTTAVILGKHVYDNSRHKELADLLILRSEGLDYLRNPGDEADGMGRKLWKGFAEISRRFARLNHRKELIAHDRQVWDRVLSKLKGVADDAAVEQDMLASLKSTWGRDLKLDQLLEFPVGLNVGVLHRAIERARGILPATTTAAPGPRRGTSTESPDKADRMMPHVGSSQLVP